MHAKYNLMQNTIDCIALNLKYIRGPNMDKTKKQKSIIDNIEK